MSEIILACSMLENEIRLAMQETKCDIPILWIDRGLHEQPAHLSAELQSRIDSIEATDILLAFALCGNAIAGIKSERARLIVPRFDDCIHFLVSHTPGDRGNTVDCRTLYYTDGWFDSDLTLSNKYYECAARRGEKKAKLVYHSMLKEYRSVHLIDTKAYDMKKAQKKLQSVAELFELTPGIDMGTVRILEKLFSHDWDQEFCVVAPGCSFNMMDFIKRAE